MKNLSSTLSVVGAAVVVTVGLLCQSKPLSAYAQLSKPETVETSQAVLSSYFLRQLNEFAHKNNAFYLIEGEPPHEEAAAEKNQNKEVALDTLNDLSARFNYRTERLPSGIVVFHKTYYDEKDLPSITISECVASLKDIERITDAVNPHVPPTVKGQGSLTGGMMALFGSEEFAAMQRGQAEVQARAARKTPSLDESTAAQNGLSVKSLNGEQKAEVWRLVRYLYIQEPLRDFNPALRKAKELAEQTPVFLFHDVNGLRLFGYEVKGKFFPLSNPYQLPAELREGNYASVVGAGDSSLTKFDPTQPQNKQENTEAGTPQAISLQALVQRLNVRKNASAFLSKTVVVEAELAAKRVTVAGDVDKTEPLNVIRAVAALYGLHVVNTSETISLMRVRPRSNSDAAHLGTAISEMLPLPLKNAYQQVPRPGGLSIPKLNVASDAPHPVTPPDEVLKWTAVRRLRQTVEDKINNAPNKRISLTDLDDEEKGAFAIVVMLPCLRPLADFMQKPVSSFITNFDQTVLIGGIASAHDGKKWLTVFMGRRLPNGTLVQGSGFSSRIDFP